MSRDILLLAAALASEKNVSSEIVFEALEFALSIAVKKKIERENMNVRVEINRETGDYRTFRRWLIVQDEDYTYPELEKTIEEIQEDMPDCTLQVGDYYEEELPNEVFGRQAAQTAKQIILQRIRDAEREQILNDFLARFKTFFDDDDQVRYHREIVVGTVKRSEKNGVYVEVTPKLDAFLPAGEIIPKEHFRNGDRIKALFMRVDEHNNGRKQVILSRTAPEFMRKLFEQEVPEIADGLLEIREVVRDAGLRAKIAVKSNDQRVDPQGTCIGVRGSRVNAVTNELKGERIDVVLWSPDTAQFIINALSPAQVNRIVIDEEKHAVDVIVAEEQLALAIGRGGQNVRLAAELTGWQLNIMTVQEAEERHAAEDAIIRELFVKHLSVEEHIANILVQEGFTSLEEVAYVSLDELLEIEGLDEQMVDHLRTQARDTILTQAIISEERLDDMADDLKNLEGLDQDILRDLAENGIKTRDDLADLDVEELIALTGVEPDEAVQIIKSARAHWFE